MRQKQCFAPQMLNLGLKHLLYHPVLAFTLNNSCHTFLERKNNMIPFVLVFHPFFWTLSFVLAFDPLFWLFILCVGLFFPFVPRGQNQTSLPTPLFPKLAYNGSPLFFIHWCDAFYIIFLPCFKIKIIRGATRWERVVFGD